MEFRDESGGGERFRFRRSRTRELEEGLFITPVLSFSYVLPLPIFIAFPRRAIRSIRLHHPVQLRTPARNGEIQDLGAKSFSDNLTLGGGVGGSRTGASE
jgi:hypothetical protein